MNTQISSHPHWCKVVEAHDRYECSTESHPLTQREAVSLIADMLWTRGIGSRKGAYTAAEAIVARFGIGS